MSIKALRNFGGPGGLQEKFWGGFELLFAVRMTSGQFFLGRGEFLNCIGASLRSFLFVFFNDFGWILRGGAGGGVEANVHAPKAIRRYRK